MHSDEIQKLGDLEDRHWWYAERRHIIKAALKRTIPSGWAMDVGAAAGGNTRVMRQAGWDCLALEYSETGAALAQARGLTVVRGDATKIPVGEGQLGLVVAFDVLEHIQDDLLATREIFRCLRPGGILLVAVPADMRLWSAHDEAVDHVRRYERNELQRLIEKGGFHEIEIRSWNVLLRPVVAMRRKRATASDLDDPGKLTNSSLKSIVMAERFLPLGRMPGVTLLLKARKPS